MEKTEKVKHRCKRLRTGKYLYRGVEITCVGYYEPEHRVVWEGSVIRHDVSKYCPCGDYHGYSLREVKMFIDEDLDKA